MRSMHTSFRSVGLRLESLSDRVVPSCTWTQNGTTLTITGDHTANVVDIVDDGTTLTVTCDGQNVPINGNVTDLKISLGSGNDQVTYTLQGALAADAVRNLDVHLGNGNDTFTAVLEDGTDSGGGTVASALGDGAQLNISAYGMNGKDTLSFDGSSTDVGTGSKLAVTMGGGNGKDSIDMTYGGILLGDLTLTQSGGNGKDALSADATLDATSTGNVDVEELAGNAPDTMHLFVTDNTGSPSMLASMTATADGGRAPDSADVTDNVDVLGAKVHP